MKWFQKKKDDSLASSVSPGPVTEVRSSFADWIQADPIAFRNIAFTHFSSNQKIRCMIFQGIGGTVISAEEMADTAEQAFQMALDKITSATTATALPAIEIRTEQDEPKQ
jgi:hypothetical protein